MKTKICFHFSLLLLTLATLACNKNDNLTFDEPVISLRTYVGWCGANDSLTIGSDNSLWVHYASCNDKVGVKKQWATESNDHQALMEILNTGDFTALDINECGHCVDGVTFELVVQQNGEKHSVRLSHDTTAAAQEQNGMAIKLLDKMRAIIEKQAEK